MDGIVGGWGVPSRLVYLVRNLCGGRAACVLTERGSGDWFDLGWGGVRRGRMLSPLLFNLCAGYIVRRAAEDWPGGLAVGGCRVSNLRCVSDAALVAAGVADMADLQGRVGVGGELLGLHLDMSVRRESWPLVQAVWGASHG